jgi:hypothetical protein
MIYNIFIGLQNYSYNLTQIGKEEVDLVLRILAKAGVTLRESSIIDVVNMEEAKKEAKET